MSLPPLEKNFIIDIVGETSGRNFSGAFTVKTVLSKREEMQADLRRRMILGPNPADALTVISNNAFVLGQLSVRVTKAPSWWEDSDGGLDLRDDNVIMAVFEEATKAEIEFRTEISKKAESATKVLKETVKKEITPEEAGDEE